MKKDIMISCEEISNIRVVNAFRMDISISNVEVDQVLDEIDNNEYILKYLLRYYTVDELTELANDLI